MLFGVDLTKEDLYSLVPVECKYSVGNGVVQWY